ncbi:MAG: DEAD/DEAH box helicase family protein [Blautia sp.]
MEKKNVYDGILWFQGTWRSYQARVLAEAQSYLQDGKIHIAAAPGAGKTTLGIELIRRCGKPCLILSPRILIRQQWLERISQSFLLDGKNPSDYLSNNGNSPSLLTAITYQSLYQAMTEQNPSAFLSSLKKAEIQTICLDECHHLKNQWWKALEDFMKVMGQVTVISLTATPPYDASPSQWQRYLAMCGPIDAEITVPELVKEGSLCPHQDYVYFNHPAGEEAAALEQFRSTAENTLFQLLGDNRLKEAVSSHKGLMDYENYYDALLDNPAYLSSLLIYAQAQGIPYSDKWLSLLQVKALPDMSEKWMELLLQGFLYEDEDSYTTDRFYKEHLIKELKAKGLIEKKQVCFCMNHALEKLLLNSRGKLDSIVKIASWEYSSMRKRLRLLILTDYIRKETRPFLGMPEKEIQTLGVLPVFELLRRQAMDWKLGILCGSLLVFPREAMEAFVKQAQLTGCFTQEEIIRDIKPLQDGSGKDLGYIEIAPENRLHLYTQILTRLFEEGEIEILIGSKSLLGEGWDSPCINALILASSVGSYVLGNQMRGRAIRIDPKAPEKVSNIWHLVSVLPEKEQQEKEERRVSRTGCREYETNMQQMEVSQDLDTLEKRMEGVMGLRYDSAVIENGMDRLSIVSRPYSPEHILNINEEMENLSSNREIVAAQWKKAVYVYEKTETVHQCGTDKKGMKPGFSFYHAVGAQILLTILQICNFVLRHWLFSGTVGENTFFLFLTLAFLLGTLFFGGRIIRWLTPMSRYKALGKGLLAALIKDKQINSACQIVTHEEPGLRFYAYLQGGTDREKALFAEALAQMLSPIENQRYLLCYGRNPENPVEYFCVPDIFAGTRDRAELFQKVLEPYIGKYRLVYTRNSEGRRLLLKGRAVSFSNKNQRKIYKRKTIKGALE